MLGLGAYLAIKGEVSPGAMIAASILTARALAPIEVAVAHWRGFVAARQGFDRLRKLLSELSPIECRLALPAPRLNLTVEGLYVVAPGQSKPIVQGVSFELKAGQGLAVIGPSASGKSTLARALIGVWPAARGRVCLDGAPIDQWDSARLGRYIGYLPQDIELFDGTVAENIARFDAEAEADDIIQAARDAAAHDMILRFPKATRPGSAKAAPTLSAGQRQRVALARALYGNPFVVVLDEPNSNLNSEGEDALVEAMHSVRQRNGIVIVVTHRPTALAGVDLVAVMIGGKLQGFGRKRRDHAAHDTAGTSAGIRSAATGSATRIGVRDGASDVGTGKSPADACRARSGLPGSLDGGLSGAGRDAARQADPDPRARRRGRAARRRKCLAVPLSLGCTGLRTIAPASSLVPPRSKVRRSSLTMTTVRLRSRPPSLPSPAGGGGFADGDRRRRANGRAASRTRRPQSGRGVRAVA